MPLSKLFLLSLSESVDVDRFELLCKDGQRRPLSEYRTCNWGLVPSHALVTSSARTQEERKHYQQFIAKAVNLYSTKPLTNFTSGNERSYEGFNRFDTKSDDKYYDQTYLNNQNSNGDINKNNPFSTRYDDGRNSFNGNSFHNPFTTPKSQLEPEANETKLFEKFDLFESGRYGGRLNLMIQDSARNLVPIKEADQSFTGYLGQSLAQIYEVRQCPVNRMTLCVTSDPEHEKCVKMRVSFEIRTNLKQTFFNENNFASLDCIEGSTDQARYELFQRPFAYQLHASYSIWCSRCDRSGCQRCLYCRTSLRFDSNYL